MESLIQANCCYPFIQPLTPDKPSSSSSSIDPSGTFDIAPTPVHSPVAPVIVDLDKVLTPGTVEPTSEPDAELTDPGTLEPLKPVLKKKKQIVAKQIVTKHKKKPCKQPRKSQPRKENC